MLHVTQFQRKGIAYEVTHLSVKDIYHTCKIKHNKNALNMLIYAICRNVQALHALRVCMHTYTVMQEFFLPVVEHLRIGTRGNGTYCSPCFMMLYYV